MYQMAVSFYVVIPIPTAPREWGGGDGGRGACSPHANFTICSCLLAQGWQSTSIVSILNKRSCCWVLQLRPRSDFGRLMLDFGELTISVS